MSSDNFNLKRVGKYFIEVAQKLQHKTLRLDLIEEKMKGVADGQEEFSIEHLNIIKDEDEKYWRFLRWWRLPEIKQKEFEKLKGKFVGLGQKNEEVVQTLFNMLKNIEIVSCVLRFICPDYYGILSSPVENLLNVKGKNPVEKYLNYLDNLTELRDEYGFSRIADVDMALWTLANILNYSELRTDPKIKEQYTLYMKKTNSVKKIMARNSLEQIWEEKSYLYIAELVWDTDYIVAGILARRELELFVRRACMRYGISEKDEKVNYRKFCDLVNGLKTKRIINEDECKSMRALYKMGSNLAHGREHLVSKNQTKDMLTKIGHFLKNYWYL